MHDKFVYARNAGIWPSTGEGRLIVNSALDESVVSFTSRPFYPNRKCSVAGLGLLERTKVQPVGIVCVLTALSQLPIL